MNKKIPILFSTPMVQAIMEGRKTMTRRVVKIQADKRGYLLSRDGTIETYEGHEFKCPYGKVGDILWVRETFTIKKLHEEPPGEKYIYRADQMHPADRVFAKWKPNIFMPKEACRLYLKITSIRIERLKSISEDDAKAEGIEWAKRPGIKPPFGWRNYQTKKESDKFICLFPSSSFETLWNSINGNKSFNKNPWVWIVSFKKISK